MSDDPFEIFRDRLEREIRELGKFNLAVIGATGAGKSTLINGVFRDEVARVGIGRPVTQHVTRIEREGVPLVIYDTKGVELGDAADEVIDEFRGLIRERRASEPSEHIHAIWYCIRAGDNRIEDFQVRLLTELAKEDVPIILVLTQCPTPESEDVLVFKDVIGQLSLPIEPHGSPILTLAKSMRLSTELTLPAFGLEELLHETLRVAPEAAHKAIINAEQVDLDLKASRARKELSGFVTSALGVGFTPIPFSDAPLLMGVQLTMLARIATVFGVASSKETLGPLVLAATGAGGAAAAGRYIVTNLLRFVPGGNMAAGAIRAGVAASLTTALGEAYIRVCREILQRDLAGEDPFAADEVRDLVLQYYREFLKNYKPTE